MRKSLKLLPRLPECCLVSVVLSPTSPCCDQSVGGGLNSRLFLFVDFHSSENEDGTVPGDGRRSSAHHLYFFLNNGRSDKDCFLPLVLALMYQKVELLQCESRVFPGRYPGIGRFYHPLMFVYCS